MDDGCFPPLTAVSTSQSVRWKTADLLSLTDLFWQYWQPVLTAWCFYFAHISGNTKARLAPSGSNWPAGHGASFSFTEQKSFGKQILDFWSFLYFNLFFNTLKMAAVCYFLGQKLPMGVLYPWQKDGLLLLSSLECCWGDVSVKILMWRPGRQMQCPA